MKTSNNIDDNYTTNHDSYPTLDAMLLDLLGTETESPIETTATTTTGMMKKEGREEEEEEQLPRSETTKLAVTEKEITTEESYNSNTTQEQVQDQQEPAASVNGGLQLHPHLQRHMSNGVVQRVSFYSLIHAINEETKKAATTTTDVFSATVLMIDEEQWLLDTIAIDSTVVAIDSDSRIHNRMYEKKYYHKNGTTMEVHNVPHSSLSSTSTTSHSNSKHTDTDSMLYCQRTRLWKPSHSWWEAKSHCNASLETEYHNKRWTYL